MKFRKAEWACGYKKADRKCVQNSVKVTSWKTSTLNINVNVYVHQLMHLFISHREH